MPWLFKYSMLKSKYPSANVEGALHSMYLKTYSAIRGAIPNTPVNIG